MLAYKVTCGYDKFRHPYDGNLRVSTVCKSDVSDLKYCTEMKPAVSCVSTYVHHRYIEPFSVLLVETNIFGIFFFFIISSRISGIQ